MALFKTGFTSSICIGLFRFSVHAPPPILPDAAAALHRSDPASLHADLIVSTRKSIRTALKQFFFYQPYFDPV